jgi:predicted CXXCH cytochrome family protein
MRSRPSATTETPSRWLALALVLAIPAVTLATGGAYRESPHGSRATGVFRVPGARRGECAQCHGSPLDPQGRRPRDGRHAGLFAPNDNGLCLSCHRPTGGGRFLGDPQYAQSAHARSRAMVWPGPAPRGRPAADAGKCVNCHDPHGAKDAAGLIPAMLRVREPALCLTCHSGSAGPDVASPFAKSYRHPLVADRGPVSANTLDVALPGAVRAGAATCSACHNPHVAGADPVRPRAPNASKALLGVARVRVSNGAPGTSPLFTAVPASDTSLVREYELCFKCHSNANGTPALRADLAADLNPANASFHPVEAQGRNTGVDRRSFAQGWSPDRLVTCSDCHAPDGDAGRGPHGSSYPHILKKPYNATTRSQPTTELDLCFECHAYRTYGDPAGGPASAFSRYPGHASHVAKGISCFGCHDAHGSAFQPALLALRSPGLSAYAQDIAGAANCTTSCHVTTPQTVSYRATYGR